jgi:hypothetical protein
MSKAQVAVGLLGAEKPYNAAATTVGQIDWKAGWELYKLSHPDTRTLEQLGEAVVYKEVQEPSSPLLAKMAIGFPGTKQAVPADMDIPTMCKQIASYSLSNLKKTATNKASRLVGQTARKGFLGSMKMGMRAMSLKPLTTAPGEIVSKLPNNAIVFNPYNPLQRFTQNGQFAANAKVLAQEFVYVREPSTGAGTIARYKKVRMGDTIPGTDKTYLQDFQEYKESYVPSMKLSNFTSMSGKRGGRTRKMRNKK